MAGGSADQRAGLAVTLGPGVCYRMWSKATEPPLQPHRTPAIMEADLGSLALDLANWGIMNPNQLDWVTEPPKGAMHASKEMLEELGATENGRITDHGKNRCLGHHRTQLWIRCLWQHESHL